MKNFIDDDYKGYSVEPEKMTNMQKALIKRSRYYKEKGLLDKMKINAEKIIQEIIQENKKN